MKREQLELITAAVADAVKLRLPAMIDAAVRSNLEAAVATVAIAATSEREPVIAANAVRAAMEAHATRASELRSLDDATLATLREDFEKLRHAFVSVMEAHEAALNDRAAGIVREAVAATMQAHEARIGEFRRLDETVLTTMREELTRMRVEFDDGLQTHYEATRRELALQTSHTIATALMDRMQGPPGPPGRDGSFAAVTHWTEGAKVARGACVQHRGGLWFANVDSTVAPDAPCSGYTLMLDGCEPVRVEPDEHGYLWMVLLFASGREKKVPMGYRPEQYAGVYDAERDYMPGDLVTCEGSLWRARLVNRSRRPNTDAGGASWQLIVKRGKDGRDGTDGMQGPAGERGPPGEPPPPRKRASTNGATS